MLKRQTLLCLVIVATSAIVFAQNNQTQVPDFRSGSPSKALSSAMAASARDARERSEATQAEILTDTKGVDFAPYVAKIRTIVRSHWMQMIPSGAYPPLLKQGKVSIDFFIGRAGKVDGVKVHESSGNAQLDHAAWESIEGSDPFPPLAMEFSSEKIGLRFHFLYNLRPGDDFSVFLPAADVSVPPGSTLQFSVSNAGVAAGAVMWSVSGAGCEKSACGTISSAGLYTAPAKIPNPPTVIVEGTLQRDAGVQNSCEVTIVEAAPSN